MSAGEKGYTRVSNHLGRRARNLCQFRAITGSDRLRYQPAPMLYSLNLDLWHFSVWNKGTDL